MNFLELFCDSAMNVNFNVPFDYSYEYDSAGLGIGCPFVEIFLKRSSILTTMTQKLISKDIPSINFKTMPNSKFTFSIIINGYSLYNINPWIRIRWTRGGMYKGFPDMYYIHLSDNEQEEIFKSIESQIKKRMGKSCDDLLKLAEKRYFRKLEEEEMDKHAITYSA